MPANLLDEPEVGAERKKDYHWTLNFGPQHPATHTTLRLVLELDGESDDINYQFGGKYAPPSPRPSVSACVRSR